ncbi:MAG: Crp/Fnr family transcriptional regulator [Burkholderiaceae bacterium]
MTDTDAVPCNQLLAALPAGALRTLLREGALNWVSLSAGDVLHEQGRRIDQVYFPVDAVIAFMAVATQRMTLEVGLVGDEGLAGIAVALGSVASPVHAVVRRSGTALCAPADAFRLALAQHSGLAQAVAHHAHGLMVQANQAAFCSHFHLLEARLARSLLMMRDRVQSNALHLTHEILGLALGVRRVGITKAATSLQQRGLISYSRGEIRILDRQGLEVASCGCYALVKKLAEAEVC